MGCLVLLCVLLSSGKRSDDEQSWNGAWVTAWAAFIVSFRHLHLYLLLDFDGERLQLSICLLTLPGVLCPICHYRETVLSYPCPCSAVSMWSNSAPMRADAPDAVISHSGLIVTLCYSSLPSSTLVCWLVSFFSRRLFAVIQTMNVVVINQQTHWCVMCILRWLQ